MSHNPKSTHIHRYWSHVALAVIDPGAANPGETVYISAEDARAIGEALIAAANDIDNEPTFSVSEFGPKEIKHP